MVSVEIVLLLKRRERVKEIDLWRRKRTRRRTTTTTSTRFQLKKTEEAAQEAAQEVMFSGLTDRGIIIFLGCSGKEEPKLT